jgi:two-component system, NtrC family, response regulator HydG
MLVVDDDPVIAVMLQRYFTSLGFTVDNATSLPQALERAGTERYALILSDLRMGGGSDGREGLELVRFVRERSASTGLIVLTAYLDPQILARAHSLGADRVLQKPQTFKELVRIIGEVLEARSGVRS